MKFPNTSNINAFEADEVLFQEYKHHLDNLLKIIKEIGEPLEGNVFYKHLDVDPGHDLLPNFKNKRFALATFAMAHDHIVEIGFNAGFSALLMLTANPDLTLISVDICEHKYTEPCFEYLKSAFPDRISLAKGDSTKILPGVLANNKDLTGYIIDGGHGLSVAEQDLRNVLYYANPNAVLCFDDSDFPKLRMLLNVYIMSGLIVPVWDPYGYVQNGSQMFFKMGCNNCKTE